MTHYSYKIKDFFLLLYLSNDVVINFMRVSDAHAKTRLGKCSWYMTLRLGISEHQSD